MINEVSNSITDKERLTKTISTLSLKIRELEIEKASIIEKYEKENEKLKMQLSAANKGTFMTATTEKHKQTIKLFAFGFSIGHIYKVMTEEMNIDITIDEIDSIVNGIDFAHEELQKFYIEMKKLFQEKNSLDKGFFASSLYKRLQLIENELSISMSKAKEIGDENLKIKCTENLLKVYEKMSTMFSKNGLDIFSKTLSTKITDDYDKKTDAIFDKKNKDEDETVLILNSNITVS